MTSGTDVPAPVRQRLAEIPSDIKTCFDQVVPRPPKGDLTREDIIRLIGDFKKSEAAKSRCGKRLIAFYEAQR